MLYHQPGWAEYMKLRARVESTAGNGPSILFDLLEKIRTTKHSYPVQNPNLFVFFNISNSWIVREDTHFPVSSAMLNKDVFQWQRDRRYLDQLVTGLYTSYEFENRGITISFAGLAKPLRHRYEFVADDMYQSAVDNDICVILSPEKCSRYLRNQDLADWIMILRYLVDRKEEADAYRTMG